MRVTASDARHLLLTGGTLVAPEGRVGADILVVGEQIAAIASPGALNGADEILDATGLLILPGLVDAHVHLRDPGFPTKEDFGSGSHAAAAGGITTVIVMPHDDPVASTADLLHEKVEVGALKSLVDYALLGAVGPANLHELGSMAAFGAAAVEAWLAHSPPAVGPVTPWDLRRILLQAKKERIPVGVYCEDETIVTGARELLMHQRRRDVAAFAASRPPIGEQLGVATTCLLAIETGATVHLRQLSTGRSIEVAAAAKGQGADLTLEVTPHHLALSAETADSTLADPTVLPPLRGAEEMSSVRGAVLRGAVEVVASDHAPHAVEEKAGTDDIWQRPPGFAGLETMLSILLTSLGPSGPEVVARVCAEAPARRFGLSRRKGRIYPGLDADLVLVDPDATWTVAPERLHTRARSSPFAGQRLHGVVRYTILRGQIVAAEGDVLNNQRGMWLRAQHRPVAET